MNVLLIAIDTLRADHLGCYGYHRDTSPRIDAFAKEAVVFDQHIATAIPTHPAFATLMSGQYSITHGIVAHGSHTQIPRTAPWLPEAFLKANFTTCAVDNLGEWRVGYDRGYEFYIDPTRRRTLAINADNRQLNRRVVPWLEHHAQEPFFCFVHYWDPHTPYLPPRAYRKLFYDGDPFDPKHTNLKGMEGHPLGKTWRETWFNQLGGHVTDADYIEALYDSEIRYCDEGVGQLLETLKRLDIYDDTLIVLLGDHGELMYRHGIYFDHHGLYDGNLRVPLLMRHPSLPAGRLDELTGHVDVAPTLLSLAGVEVPSQMEGTALGPWLHGERSGPVREWITTQECTWQKKWAIRTKHDKFILAREDDFYHTPWKEYYNLRSDPDELDNRIDAAPERAGELERLLEGWIREKVEQNGLPQDPLLSQPLTLGRAWQEPREQGKEAAAGK